MADRSKREDATKTDAERDELIRGRATGEDEDFEETEEGDEEDVDDEGGMF